MPKIRAMVGSGISPQAAVNIQGGNFSEGGLTASGTTKATALQLPNYNNYVSICSAGKAVGLPQGDQGDEAFVFNGGGNALLVFTPAGTTDSFNNLSANAGFTLSSFKGGYFNKVTSTLWVVNKSA